MCPYFSYKNTGEKLLKYQANSPWVIISLILMTRRNLVLINARDKRVNYAIKANSFCTQFLSPPPPPPLFNCIIDFRQFTIFSLKTLDGQNIYNGCCTLHLEFSKLTTLTVKYNNDKSKLVCLPFIALYACYWLVLCGCEFVVCEKEILMQHQDRLLYRRESERSC